MQFYNLALLYLLSVAPAGGQNVADCSGQNIRFPAPKKTVGTERW